MLLAGCSTAALDGQAILRPTCAPNDAASVELVVPESSTEYPQLRVVVWRSAVEGTTVTVPGAGGKNGTAVRCRTSTDCRELPSATVSFGRMRADASGGRAIDVRIDARLPGGTRVRKSRRAKWQETRMLCG